MRRPVNTRRVAAFSYQAAQTARITMQGASHAPHFNKRDRDTEYSTERSPSPAEYFLHLKDHKPRVALDFIGILKQNVEFISLEAEDLEQLVNDMRHMDLIEIEGDSLTVTKRGAMFVEHFESLLNNLQTGRGAVFVKDAPTPSQFS
jgi:hypothetical protein